MSSKILWIDNDKIFLVPRIYRLQVEGYFVKQVLTLTEGLKELEKEGYDLLILDVMMPIQEEEDELFPPATTNFGKEAGLLFYKRYKEMIEKKGITIFVLTIREDAAIRDKFLDAGLPEKNFMTKSEGADTAVFLARVKELLEEKGHP